MRTKITIAAAAMALLAVTALVNLSTDVEQTIAGTVTATGTATETETAEPTATADPTPTQPPAPTPFITATGCLLPDGSVEWQIKNSGTAQLASLGIGGPESYALVPPIAAGSTGVLILDEATIRPDTGSLIHGVFRATEPCAVPEPEPTPEPTAEAPVATPMPAPTPTPVPTTPVRALPPLGS